AAPTPPRPRTAAERGEVIWAPGMLANARAHRTTNQAPQPLSCAIAAATGGATGATTAVRSARPSTSTTTGTATTFAGTVTSEIWWNWNHVTGAVASPHAIDTPMSCANPCDTGYPSSDRTTRGVTTKIAYGFQPRSTAAPTSSACQRSRSRPASQASDPRPAASAARTTDGWSPTASAYAATVSSAAVWAT